MLTGCGGSSSRNYPAGPRSGASASSRTVPRTTAGLHRDKVTYGLVSHRPMRGTGGSEINDDNPGTADSGSGETRGQNPCSLVSKAQAQATIGKPIDTPVEAPLGPTCIYQETGAKTTITVAVESMDLTKIQAQIRNRRQIKVDQHTATCGTYGQPVTLVQLEGGRVLDITGPCAIGVRFMRIAIPRVKP